MFSRWCSRSTDSDSGVSSAGPPEPRVPGPSSSTQLIDNMIQRLDTLTHKIDMVTNKGYFITSLKII